MAEETKVTGGGREGTLVRGADGVLYLITKDSAPVKLDDEKAGKVMNIIGETKGKLEKILNDELAKVQAGCNQNVQIHLPEVRME